MLIRFLDSKENCYQVDSYKTPVLIVCETEEEIKTIKKLKLGDCVVSIPKGFEDDKTKRCYEKLNTKDEPKTLK